MPDGLTRRLHQRLQQRRNEQSLRILSKDTPVIDFCSNDYLGIARESFPERNSHGATGSRLLSGNRRQTETTEQQLAEFHGFSNGLLFSTGYSANLGLLACLGERGDRIILDDYAHASLMDGARLSFAKRCHFTHNSLASLETQLAQSCRGQTMVVVESIYSMDGDRAPLQDIADLCRTHDAALIVDEAHAIGVTGHHGRGLVAENRLQSRVLACIYTFGKALGCHGALICGNDTLRDYLINFCRPFIYSTAPPSATVTVQKMAHDLMVKADDRRRQLNRLIDFFRHRIAETSLQMLDSTSPIQGILVTGNERCRQTSAFCRQQGFDVKAILAPTVPSGRERIRICLHSFNTTEQIDRLIATLERTVSP